MQPPRRMPIKKICDHRGRHHWIRARPHHVTTTKEYDLGFIGREVQLTLVVPCRDCYARAVVHLYNITRTAMIQVI